jgi:diguanylate cyclase (GGDEF)-like protein
LPNPFLVFRPDLPFIELTEADRLREEAPRVAEPITKPATALSPVDSPDARLPDAIEPATAIVTLIDDIHDDHRYRPVLLVYVAGVIALAAGIQASLVVRAAALWPTSPSAFVFFFALALAAELRPISWLGPDKGEIAASWTFLLGLFFTAPTATAALASTLIALTARTVNRQPPVRILFNTFQSTLSLVVGYLAVEWCTGRSSTMGLTAGPSTVWVIGTILVGAVAFGINMLLTAGAIALDNRVSVITLMRDSVGTTMAMDLMLIGLTPVFVAVALRSLFLGAILAATVWAIHKTSTVALGHRHEATHDLLTQLPNRRNLSETAAGAISGARRRGEGLAIVQVNIDCFKGINERLGRAVGDQVLASVAQRLRKDRRGSDIVARLDGDEFIVLLNSPCSLEDAMKVAKVIEAELRRPLLLNNVPLTIGASISLACFPTHGDDIDALLSAADSAMYRAKKVRNGPEMYHDEHGRTGPSRMFLASEILQAINNEEFFVAFQPKLDLHTNVIIGVEALIRWSHPKRGILFPDSFIATAEQTDLMQPLTEYVLHKALQQCALWHREGLYLSVAVNVSARNLHDRSFVDAVRRLLALHALDAMWLELELTENTVMADPDRTALVLEELHQLGVQIALDDFGTGFSSIANLRTLPVDRVKIDKTFVFGMLHSRRDESIVRSIIDLAHNLGLGTVAEGVETKEVLDRLTEMQCGSVQGYYIGKPISALEIRNLCRDGEFNPPTNKKVLP